MEGARHSSVQTVTAGLQPCSVARALSGCFMSACWGHCPVAADPRPPQGSCEPRAVGERAASGGRVGLGQWAGRVGRQSPWAHGLTLGPFPSQFLACSVSGNFILTYTEAEKSCNNGTWNHSVLCLGTPILGTPLHLLRCPLCSVPSVGTPFGRSPVDPSGCLSCPAV